MKNNDFGKVAVLMGGNSSERAVSLRSGQAVLNALLESGVDAVGVDAAHHLLVRLTETQFDTAFIALHGRGGEDGTIQGLLEYLQIPYTGSGVLASALAMDKYRTKQIWHSLGLSTPPFSLVTSQSPAELVAQLGLPLMIKPVLEGSSIGITKVVNAADLPAAIVAAQQYRSPVMAEKFIEGQEYTVGILGDEALPSIRIEIPQRIFYDYQAKYHDDQTQYHCPSGLSPAREEDLKKLALAAFSSIGGSGWGRVDMMLDSAGRAWLLEINTVPGMTDHSLVPMAAKVAHLSFNQLVLRILASIPKS